MAVARKILPLLFVVALAGPFCRWLVASIGKPLWADELITVALVKTASFPHLLAAVLLGLDATPPLYTGYGWLILHHVFQETPPELLLRLTNAALVGATLWILYLLIRCYFGQVTALTTIGAFVLLEMWPLKFLTLEVRTYAALVFFATLSVYFGLRALARPTWVTLTGAMLAYCLLVSSHTFGIIYVVSIATCAVAAAAGNFRLALTSALSAAPAATMFGLWLPVLHHQAQLGSWIFRPDLASLLSSTHLSADRLWVLVVLVVLAVLTLLLRGYRLREGLSPAQWWRSSNRTLRFALCLPIAFYGSTFAVWLFSRFVFPVFVQRYFYPNMILNTIWLSIAIDLILGYVILATTRYWLALGSAVLAGLFIRQWQWPEYSIPCFDASRKAYIEDPFIDNGPIVAL